MIQHVKQASANCHIVYVQMTHEQIRRNAWSRLDQMAEIAFEQDHLWFRLTGDPAEIMRTSALLSGVTWFVVDNRLVRRGHRVAEMAIPDLVWRRIGAATNIILPVPRVAARIDPSWRVPMSLSRSANERPAGAILATIDDASDWVQSAPLVRLKPLRWVSRANDCLIVGEPLPPIAGRYFTVVDRVLAPVGFAWRPAVSPTQLRRVFVVGDDQWLLWESDDQWGTIEDDYFAALSRASVRLR